MARARTAKNQAGDYFRQCSEEVRILHSRMRFVCWDNADPEVDRVMAQLVDASESLLQIAIGRNREEAERIEAEERPLFARPAGVSPFSGRPLAQPGKVQAPEEPEAEEGPPAAEVKVIEPERFRAAALGLSGRVSTEHLIGDKPADRPWPVTPTTLSLPKYPDRLWVMTAETILVGGAVEQHFVEACPRGEWMGRTKGEPGFRPEPEQGPYWGQEAVTRDGRELVLCGGFDALVIGYPPPSWPTPGDDSDAAEQTEGEAPPANAEDGGLVGFEPINGDLWPANTPEGADRPDDQVEVESRLDDPEWDLYAGHPRHFAARVKAATIGGADRMAADLFGRRSSWGVGPALEENQAEVIRAGGFSGHGTGRKILAAVADEDLLVVKPESLRRSEELAAKLAASPEPKTNLSKIRACRWIDVFCGGWMGRIRETEPGNGDGLARRIFWQLVNNDDFRAKGASKRYDGIAAECGARFALFRNGLAVQVHTKRSLPSLAADPFEVKAMAELLGDEASPVAEPPQETAGFRIKPGMVVRTSYSTGPYRVLRVVPVRELYCPACGTAHPTEETVYSMGCEDLRDGKGASLNQYREEGGRFLYRTAREVCPKGWPDYWKPNEDELFIVAPEDVDRELAAKVARDNAASGAAKSTPARKSPERRFVASYFPTPEAEPIPLGDVTGYSQSDVINRLPECFKGQEVRVGDDVVPIDPSRIKITPATKEPRATGRTRREQKAFDVFDLDGEAGKSRKYGAMQFIARIYGAADSDAAVAQTDAIIYGGKGAGHFLIRKSNKHLDEVAAEFGARQIEYRGTTYDLATDWALFELPGDESQPAGGEPRDQAEDPELVTLHPRIVADRMAPWVRLIGLIRMAGRDPEPPPVERSEGMIAGDPSGWRDAFEHLIPTDPTDLDLDDYRDGRGMATFLATSRIEATRGKQLFTVEGVDFADARAQIAAVNDRRDLGDRPEWSTAELRPLNDDDSFDLDPEVRPLHVKPRPRPSLRRAAAVGLFDR